MASPLSCSRRRGWPQKFCVTLLLLSTLVNLLHVVHGKDKDKDKGGSSPKKGSPPKGKDPKKDNNTFLKAKGKEKGDTKNKKETRDGKNQDTKKKNPKMNFNKKEWSKSKKEKIKDEMKEQVKKSTKELKKSDKKVSIEEEKELEAEMTFIEVDIDLTFLDTVRIFEEDEAKVLGKAFKTTYNDMITNLGLVVLKAKVVDQILFTEEEKGKGNHRNLGLRSTSQRYTRLRMRIRAAGPNTLAKRPLFRSNMNRLLLPNPFPQKQIPGPPGLQKHTHKQNEASRFIKAFDAQFLNAPDSGILQPIHSGEVPTEHVSTETPINPTETLFPFNTSLTLRNVDGKLPLNKEKFAMKNFQKAYNHVFDTSLVVNVKTMSQQLISNNETVDPNLTAGTYGTLDVVFTFTGTFYTVDEVAAEESFGQITSMTGEAVRPNVTLASERNFVNLLDKIPPWLGEEGEHGAEEERHEAEEEERHETKEEESHEAKEEERHEAK
jgi:hypothetical protein